ncbi:tol-pal system protein YbgF [Salidesulfovibrio onnuriiensis]|uniref:tol-pal system protein YbgF n=1 Tax=Salidesulfovibrio onnuriiensis TaxID=2583823 RepID=UPI0011C9B5C9|nr:tol-pal system protein YbgF [Salidesulfovibrio onnuriiensis]
MKMKRIIPIFCAGAIALSGFGCVTRTDVETMEAQNRRQNAEQRKLILQLEEELDKTRAALRNEIDKSSNPVREKTATIWIELNSLRQEFAQLKGDMEIMELRMDRQLGDANATMDMAPMKDRVKDIEFALENQLNVDLSSAAKPKTEAQAEAKPADKVTVGKPEAKPEAQADPAKALYDRAYDLYKEGKYEDARSYWAEFVKSFPKHPYVASALFWQGQSYYKMKNYSNAAVLYDDVIQKYPKSSKYRAAMLKQAYSLHYLGKTKIAKFLLQELIDKHPKSVEATQAKSFLEKLK